jgi:hypothetical protein
MSAVVTATPRAAVTPRTVDEWAKVIADDLTGAVAGIIAAGQHLQEAKAEVDHGEWLPLLERLKMGASTAARLMRIAENEVLRNSAHWAELPTSWRTLYELTTLPPETLEAKIAEGVITRETKRKEVTALRNAEPKHDWEKEWVGMPSFRMQLPEPCQKINILFARWEDVEAFGKLIGQPVTPRTKSFWYPAQPKKSRKDLMYHDKDPDPPLDDVEDVRGGDRAETEVQRILTVNATDVSRLPPAADDSTSRRASTARLRRGRRHEQ